MMAKEPSQRLPSAAAARHELLAWADKGPGLPLDRPEDTGYEHAVALLESQEPSEEQIDADVVPPAEVLSAAEESPRTEPPAETPVPEAIPMGIPVPSRPRPKRPARAVLPETVTRPRPTESLPRLLYAIPIAIGGFLGLVVLLLLWLLLRK
jgi:hypothetical protein